MATVSITGSVGQDLDLLRIQADFLFGLAQRSSQQVGVFGLAPTAGKRDLAAVHAVTGCGE